MYLFLNYKRTIAINQNITKYHTDISIHNRLRRFKPMHPSYFVDLLMFQEEEYSYSLEDD